jgi:hypothetical protein
MGFKAIGAAVLLGVMHIGRADALTILCAGQSNAEISFNGTVGELPELGGDVEVFEGGEWAPPSDRSPDLCTRVASLLSVSLSETVRVVPAARGGTPIRSHIPTRRMEEFSEHFVTALSTKPHHAAGWVWTNIYLPLANNGAIGDVDVVVFLQGEGDANRGNEGEYEQALKTYSREIRGLFGYPRLVVVQLPSKTPFRNKAAWGGVRAVQEWVGRSMRYVDTAVMNGEGSWTDLHPRDKRHAAERVANKVLWRIRKEEER